MKYKAFALGSSPFADILAPRILHRHRAQGWTALADRVAALARQAEAARPEPDGDEFVQQLREAMVSGKLLPNSPLLVNAGEARQRIFACFAVDVQRPLAQALPAFRFIHDGMGGVGYAVQGSEPGFPALIQAIDADTVQHQAGRPRPASNAVTMPMGGRLDDFLALAGTLKVTNMNVALDDEFMADALQSPEKRARLEQVAGSIHRTGQPGIVFSDRVSRIAASAEPVMAANVCGEAPLASDESSPLASLNLVAFCEEHADGAVRLNEPLFEQHVRLAVRFLDGMHDLHCHADGAIAANTAATRKVGVGVMGFAHALMLCGMRYGDPASLAFADRIGLLLARAAMAESTRLAEVLGPYPAWRPEHGAPRRNAGLVAIAGTATIALIAGTSSGIEPLFSHVWEQLVMGQRICVLDPVVAYLLERRGVAPDDALRRLQAGEPLEAIAGAELAVLMPTATDIPGATHISVQAALQKHIDGGITKTINCPAHTSVGEIRDWLVQAHQSGCMGFTVYRAGSLEGQPMVGV